MNPTAISASVGLATNLWKSFLVAVIHSCRTIIVRRAL